jgi:hypothetical protein
MRKRFCCVLKLAGRRIGSDGSFLISHFMRTRLFITLLLIAKGLSAQQPAAVPPSAPASPDVIVPKGQEQVPGQPGVVQDKHAFGVLPNYRTAEGNLPYSPITAKLKFKIASDDTIDGPSFALAAGFAGISQLNNSEQSFGQGFKGYLHRYGTGLSDQILGNYMTEAIMPSLLHQDPRYFRKGQGSFWGRVGWAASRSVVARNDSGKWTFNYSEFIGNGTVAAIGNLYYPDDRGFSPTMQRMFTQIGTDTLSQVLKEFWPDVKRKYFSKKNSGNVPVSPELKSSSN